jgi:hypothetical protein
MFPKVRLTYRSPFFLEGVSRVFDILGTFRDDVSFQRPSVISEDSDAVEGYGDDSCYQAINKAAARVNWQMGLVGDRMRKKLNHLS